MRKISNGAFCAIGLILAIGLIAGCDMGTENTDFTAPTVISSNPAASSTEVAIKNNITVAFSEAMKTSSINSGTFTLKHGTVPVSGILSNSGTTAIFNPSGDLASNTIYTATITTGVTDLAGNALAIQKTWNFTTISIHVSSHAIVDLGTAGNFVILSKSGIDTVPTSAISGDIGVSPIDSTAITGFSLTKHISNTYATSSQLTGRAYAPDYATPTPFTLTTAVGDMETAYTDAAGRPTPDFTELNSGEIGGLTLVPGLYKWGGNVLISTNVTLNGTSTDVWIFQISGGIIQASGTRVLLAGGALPKNIFWQSSGAIALDTGAHMEGIMLCKTAITLATGASANGRLLSQTAVTLDASTVTKPAP